MAVTVETNFRPTGLNQSAITHEDFVDQLDRIEPAQTKFTSICRNEVQLKAVDRTWNVDVFPATKGARGRADRETVTTGSATDYTSGIRKMGNVAQGFSETVGIGWISSQVPQIAGKRDVLGESKTDAMLAIKQQMERAFCSTDQIAVYDAGSGLGAVMAGYRALTHYNNRYTGGTSGYAIGKPTDLHYSPSGILAITTGSIAANHSRSMWRSLSLLLRAAALRDMDWMALCGIQLRQAICDLTDPATTSVTAAATGTGAVVGVAAQQVRVLMAQESDNTIGAVVDVIRTGNGRFLVAQSDHIGQTTASGTGVSLTTGFAANTTGTWGGNSTVRAASVCIDNPYAAHIIAKGNVWKTWGVTPYTEELGNDGGGPTFDCKALATLGVANPIKAASILFTS